MKRIVILTLITVIVLGAVYLYNIAYRPATPQSSLTETKYAGLAIHPAGYQTDYSPSYWVNAANYVSSKVPNSEPIVVWVVGAAESGGICHLLFPSPEGSYPHIIFSSPDKNEEYLDAFDSAGIKVWLTVEPSDANVETLIDLVLGRYKNHTSIVGCGIDIEWYQLDEEEEAKPVTNEEATRWLNKIKSYNSSYRLRLVHWKTANMPTLHHKDVIFVDDALDFGSMNTMVNSFKNWGNNFADADVGFSIGFPEDESWWSALSDPAGEIAKKMFNEIPNCKEVYWVSWSITEIFPYQDLVLVIEYFGAYKGSERWIDAMSKGHYPDVNSDNKVDIQDLVLVIKRYGEHYP